MPDDQNWEGFPEAVTTTPNPLTGNINQRSPWLNPSYQGAPQFGAGPTTQGTPWRGARDISPQQLANLAPDKLKPYTEAFVNYGNQHGIDPLFLLANAMQEDVNPAHHNPMGISGPHGVLSFNPQNADARIKQQVAFMANPTGPYAGANSVEDWARIYSPPNAANAGADQNLTKATDTITILNKLQAQAPQPLSTMVPQLQAPLASMIPQPQSLTWEHFPLAAGHF